MKYLLYFPTGSLLLGIAWIVACYTIPAWRRRAEQLDAWYASR